MTTWYNAQQGIVEAANAAMAEQDDEESCREIWEPIANALIESAPSEFERDWPELWTVAQALGPDFVGITSDTRRVVAWGAAHPHYRAFEIMPGENPRSKLVRKIKARRAYDEACAAAGRTYDEACAAARRAYDAQ